MHFTVGSPIIRHPPGRQSSWLKPTTPAGRTLLLLYWLGSMTSSALLAQSFWKTTVAATSKDLQAQHGVTQAPAIKAAKQPWAGFLPFRKWAASPQQKDGGGLEAAQGLYAGHRYLQLDSSLHHGATWPHSQLYLQDKSILQQSGEQRVTCNTAPSNTIGFQYGKTQAGQPSTSQLQLCHVGYSQQLTALCLHKNSPALLSLHRTEEWAMARTGSLHL